VSTKVSKKCSLPQSVAGREYTVAVRTFVNPNPRVQQSAPSGSTNSREQCGSPSSSSATSEAEHSGGQNWSWLWKKVAEKAGQKSKSVSPAVFKIY